MSTELVNISGLRADGRRSGEVRRVRAQLGVIRDADGSAVVRQGATLVLASCSGPASRLGAADGAPGIVEVELTIAPFATPERRIRRRGDRRVGEMEAATRSALESVVEAKLFPRGAVTLRLSVLQADGGLLAGEFLLKGFLLHTRVIIFYP